MDPTCCQGLTKAVEECYASLSAWCSRSWGTVQNNKPLPLDHPLRGLAIGKKIERINVSLPSFLLKQGISVNTKESLGEGGNARVYTASVQDIHNESQTYAYKNDNAFSFKDLDFQKTVPFSRARDLAVSRVYDVPYLIRPLVFILLVEPKNGQQEQEAYYVPVDCVKEFRKKWVSDDQIVTLQGTLMELALGKNLESVLEETPSLLSPNQGGQGAENFTMITNALLNALLKMYDHNLIHGDIKPSNIVVDFNKIADEAGEDQEGGKVISVKIVDFGSSERLCKRTKSNDSKYSKISYKRSGTLAYMSPSVFYRRTYGSEIDFFSAAMTSLNLISREDFTFFNNLRFTGRGDRLSYCEADKYLDFYLSKLPQNSSTISLLQTQPEIERKIRLCFTISRGGERGETALAELRGIVPPPEESPFNSSDSTEIDSFHS